LPSSEPLLVSFRYAANPQQQEKLLCYSVLKTSSRTAENNKQLKKHSFTLSLKITSKPAASQLLNFNNLRTRKLKVPFKALEHVLQAP
jgi:hypothetical protein